MLVRLLPALCLAALVAHAEPRKVLFLTHSAGYRHGVVTRPKDGGLSLAERQLTKAAALAGFDVVCTQNCEDVTAESLKQYAAVGSSLRANTGMIMPNPVITMATLPASRNTMLRARL